MYSCYLFLVLAVAVVNSQVVDLNSAVDQGLAKTNEYLRHRGFTSVNIPPGTFGPQVSFAISTILGLDSLKRTGYCTLETVGNKVTVDLHYGFGFYQHSFKFLKINDAEMSASYRVRDNSVHLKYTVQNIGQPAGRCSVTVHDLSVERLAKVEFSSSNFEYDGIEATQKFKESVVPFINGKVNKGAVATALERFACKEPRLEISEHMPLVHQALLEQIVN